MPQTLAAKSGTASHFGKHNRTNSRLSARTLSAGRLHTSHSGANISAAAAAGGNSNLGFTALKGAHVHVQAQEQDHPHAQMGGKAALKRNDSNVSVRSDLTVQRGHGPGVSCFSTMRERECVNHRWLMGFWVGGIAPTAE